MAPGLPHYFWGNSTGRSQAAMAHMPQTMRDPSCVSLEPSPPFLNALKLCIQKGNESLTLSKRKENEDECRENVLNVRQKFLLA